MLHCRRCGSSQILGLSERIALLRRAGKLRRDARPDRLMVDALLEAELPRLACEQCGQRALELQADAVSPDDPLDPEEWGEGRRCVGCNGVIHPERLEVLPDTRQCSQCAAAGKTGRADEREFCPRCGAEIRLVAVRSGGLARYAMHCSGCGFRS